MIPGPELPFRLREHVTHVATHEAVAGEAFVAAECEAQRIEALLKRRHQRLQHFDQVTRMRVRAQDSVRRQLLHDLAQEGAAREARVIDQSDYNDRFHHNPQVLRGSAAWRSRMQPATQVTDRPTLTHHADEIASLAAQTRALMLTRKDPADPAETLPGGPWNAHENAEKALDAIAAESQVFGTRHDESAVGRRLHRQSASPSATMATSSTTPQRRRVGFVLDAASSATLSPPALNQSRNSSQSSNSSFSDADKSLRTVDRSVASWGWTEHSYNALVHSTAPELEAERRRQTRLLQDQFRRLYGDLERRRARLAQEQRDHAVLRSLMELDRR